MSAVTTMTRSARWKPAVALAAVLGVLSFLSGPTAPLGFFWRPSPVFPTPTPAQLPFLIGLGLAEAITFGAGIAFLLFGYPAVRGMGLAGPTLTRLAHLCISWMLFSWFPHDSLHIHFGENLNQLIAIEYGFHVSLMIAAGILAYFFLTLAGRVDSARER